jgi:hypothetical protein
VLPATGIDGHHHRRAMGASPLLQARAASPSRLGLKANLAGPCNLGQAKAISPSGPCAQYFITISIWIILNHSNGIQTSEFTRKFNKFHKNMKPPLVFDFKDNLQNKI